MSDARRYHWHYGCRQRVGRTRKCLCKRCKARGLTELWQSAHGGAVCRKCRDEEIVTYRAARAAAAARAAGQSGGGKGAAGA